MPVYQKGPCPVCQNWEYKVIGKVDIENSKVMPSPEESYIVSCSHCRLLYVYPMPYWSEDEFSMIYGDEYFPNIPSWWLNFRANIAPKRRMELINNHLQNNKKTLLELGAGIYAFMCRYLKTLGWETVAQEPSKVFCRELEELGIKTLSTPFLEIPRGKRYALIYADSVFEHVPNPVDYFAKSFELLEPGGILYFISPNEYSLENKILTFRNKFTHGYVRYLCPYDSYHLVGFSKKSMEVICQKTGFTLGKFLKRYGQGWRRELNKWYSYKSRESSYKDLLIKGTTSYTRAIVRYAIDFLGYGPNLEVLLKKEN
jgi:SAM-dependent methyltransferase